VWLGKRNLRRATSEPVAPMCYPWPNNTGADLAAPLNKRRERVFNNKRLI